MSQNIKACRQCVREHVKLARDLPRRNTVSSRTDQQSEYCKPPLVPECR